MPFESGYFMYLLCVREVILFGYVPETSFHLPVSVPETFMYLQCAELCFMTFLSLSHVPETLFHGTVYVPEMQCVFSAFFLPRVRVFIIIICVCLGYVAILSHIL